MGTVTKLNDVLCANISKVDDILKANASKWDDNTFCPSSPTPTPTVTVTPTPTPTQSPAGVTPTPTPTITPSPAPCDPGCCFVELCYSDRDCAGACQCTEVLPVYLHQPCQNDPCELAYADGIFEEGGCTAPAVAGYYSSGVDCYYWDGSALSYQGSC